MNRFEILILDRRNGIICSEHMDVSSTLSFFHRSGRAHHFQVVARKGDKAIFIEKIDPATIAKILNDFNLSHQ
jgi:hypothetical protein